MEYELKYIVPNHKLHPALDIISSVCCPDNQYRCATISSIYYDSSALHGLDEKINSDFYKSKYRLRWYRDSESGTLSDIAYMEAKKRIGSQRLKKRTQSTLMPDELDSMELEDSRLRDLPNVLGHVGIIPGQRLLPALLIRYQRQRFVDPVSGSRVSVDSDICVPRHNKHLLPRATRSMLHNAVIEFKGDGASIPHNLKPLVNFGLRKSSFSKYLSCFARSHHMVFDPR